MAVPEVPDRGQTRLCCPGDDGGRQAHGSSVDMSMRLLWVLAWILHLQQRDTGRWTRQPGQ
jgi:hypothetical protein